MHLADTFIQRDLQCIQAIHFSSVFLVNSSPFNEQGGEKAFQELAVIYNLLKFHKLFISVSPGHSEKAIGLALAW